jgi:hypothetical protein
MAVTATTVGEALALSAGYEVAADDGVVGEVETPLFPPDRNDPDYLVLRTRGRFRTRYPVLPVVLVDAVDTVGRVVRVRGATEQIRGLPEHLPVAV